MGHGNDLNGKRVTVVGLGTLGGGVGVARYAAQQGARVTVTDMRDAEALASSLRELEGLPIVYHLGGHDVRDFLPESADMIVRNPGVRRDSEFLNVARNHGVPIEMEMSLFFRACPAPLIGVTGTKGKTTVTTLIGDMLRAWEASSVVAGNMGISALSALGRITESTPVVVEVSSWQLEALDEHGLAPHIAVLTNIYEDHLTHYDGFEDYAATKRSIAHHAREYDVVVYSNNQDHSRSIVEVTRGRSLPFSREEVAGDAAWIDGERLCVRWEGCLDQYQAPTHLSLSGESGRSNALAAVAAATVRGVPPEAIDHALRCFAGVPDRLEVVEDCHDVTFINDTSATAPMAVATTIRLLRERSDHLTVIAGGTDKASSFDPMAEAIADTDATLILLDGTGTPRLQECLERRGLEVPVPFGSLSEAFEAAVGTMKGKGIVALSPGCASFGMFRNEFDRGEQFRELARDYCAGLRS